MYAVGVGSRREPDVPRHNFHKRSGIKNWWIGDAVQRDGDRVTPSRLSIKPCFGSTIVVWDLEYIESVHENQVQ